MLEAIQSGMRRLKESRKTERFRAALNGGVFVLSGGAGLAPPFALLTAFAAALILIPGAACAQSDQPPEQPAQVQPLLNDGKPMVVEYHCTADDIHSAGLSCTLDDPCPLFLELAAVESVGNRIFVAGNIHSPTTTLSSVLLTSDDDGKTWREPYERLRLAGFDSIQFIDFENGWVSGEVQHPLPRDPFLLVTADGGKTWRQRLIFGDPQFGAIQQFWFSSRTGGGLIVDRGRAGELGHYELYETPNGGETWMLRQTSEKPLQLKRAPATANADWRLRADAAIKAYRVEHRAEDRWRSIAAFSVSIGFCRPPRETPPQSSAPVPDAAKMSQNPR